MAKLLAARRGHPGKIEGVSDPADPDRELNENGALLPGPGAILAGPTLRSGSTRRPNRPHQPGWPGPVPRRGP